MSCARCSLCGISYPDGMRRCRVCDGTLDRMAHDPHEDWEDRASAAAWERVAERQAQALGDDVVAWRLGQLLSLGVELDLAEQLAADRQFDYHALAALVHRGCPVSTAIQILA